MAETGDQRIGGGFVEISAEMAPFDAAMAALPEKARKQIQAAQAAIQQQLASKKLDLAAAISGGDSGKISALTAEIALLERQLATIPPTVLKQASSWKAVSASIKEAEAAQNQVAAGAVRAGQVIGQGANFGAFKWILLAQAVDDVQYGLSAIVNNVPMLLLAFTNLGGGIGAAISIGFVAINVLVEHWSKFLNLIGQGKVKTEADEMEELAKKTHRTADEQERLNKLKREAQDLEEIRGTKTPGERGDAAKFNRAVDATGGPQAEAAIKAALRQRNIDTKQAFRNAGVDKETERLMIQAKEGNPEALDMLADLMDHGLLGGEFKKAFDAPAKAGPGGVERGAFAGGAAINRELEQEREKQRRTAEGLAGEFMKGPEGDKAIQGQLTKDEVRKRVEELNITIEGLGNDKEGKFDKAAEAIFDAIQKDVARVVRQKAIRTGLDDDDARKVIKAENDVKGRIGNSDKRLEGFEAERARLLTATADSQPAQIFHDPMQMLEHLQKSVLDNDPNKELLKKIDEQIKEEKEWKKALLDALSDIKDLGTL